MNIYGAPRVRAGERWEEPMDDDVTMCKRAAPATYVESIALDIWQATGGKGWYPNDEAALWLGYAVLALSKGEETESRDVHDAWSAWATVKYEGVHRSLIPFDDLTPEVQAYDNAYRDAIRLVAVGLDAAAYVNALRQEAHDDH